MAKDEIFPDQDLGCLAHVHAADAADAADAEG